MAPTLELLVKPAPDKQFHRYMVGISTKMYFSNAQTLDYINALQKAFPKDNDKVQLFFIPSFTSIYPCAAILQAQSETPHILLGGQDCHSATGGAHTGSVSAAQLAEIGCSIVELGHAERKEPPFNESNELIASKVASALRAGLIPLVCIGEKQKSNIASESVGLAIREVNVQIEPVLQAVGAGMEDGKEIKLILAYEPVWAIGAGEPASPDHVIAVIKQVKQLVEAWATEKRCKLVVKYLYGGSAGPGTWGPLSSSFDGLFLGRFAHDTKNVQQVVEEICH